MGAIVAAPDGARMIYNSVRGWIVTSYNRLTKRAQVIQVSGIGDIGSASEAVTVTKAGWALDEEASVAEQVKALRAYIENIEIRLNEMVNALSDEGRARKAAITELSQTLEQRLDQLRALIDQKDQRAARVDARGLPLIGGGIFLNGVPEELAGLPWHLGWLLPFFAFGAMVAVLTSIAQSRRASQTP
ncbi:hypothetical protein [Nonomuraea wenchangensis]|uniref:hypothetical protein n=1 Tax=Nonomuraea wenchangensis TaxID=568860 RepID=UPI0011606B7A|nr:hypothetical protein [Nonomuraea wenchangensis]